MSLHSASFVSSLIAHKFVYEQFFFFFFCLVSACLLNKFKTKAQVWLIYKQINMNEVFIVPKLELFMNDLVYLEL